MTRTLVDAFNLLHAVPSLRRAVEESGPGRACAALLDVCGRWVERGLGKGTLVLVFDGVRPRGVPLGARPGLEVRFVDDADADLLVQLERSGAHTLVSMDAELVAAARRLATEVVAPRAFYQRLLDDLRDSGEVRQKQAVPGVDEVAYWVSVFRDPPPDRPPPEAPTPPAEPAPPKPKPEGLSEDQVQDWLRWFGER